MQLLVQPVKTVVVNQGAFNVVMRKWGGGGGDKVFVTIFSEDEVFAADRFFIFNTDLTNQSCSLLCLTQTELAAGGEMNKRNIEKKQIKS